MAKINSDKEAQIGPFTVVIIDATDAYYYADVFDDDRMKPAMRLDDLGKAKALADAFFVLENIKWNSLQEMNSSDSGSDVRVYNKDFVCVYAAHERFKEKWIGD